MTFSLSPTRLSTLPARAASVSTFVVSWKLAAEMKLELWTLAFVIPSNWVLAVAGFGLVPLDGVPPRASIWALAWARISFGTTDPTANSLSPLSVIRRLSEICLLASWKSNLSMTLPGSSVVSPTDSIFTLRSICDTIISMCLSSMSTRWLR